MKQQLIELGHVIGTAFGTTVVAAVIRFIEKRRIKQYYRSKMNKLK